MMKRKETSPNEKNQFYFFNFLIQHLLYWYSPLSKIGIILDTKFFFSFSILDIFMFTDLCAVEWSSLSSSHLQFFTILMRQHYHGICFEILNAMNHVVLLTKSWQKLWSESRGVDSREMTTGRWLKDFNWYADDSSSCCCPAPPSLQSWQKLWSETHGRWRLDAD